MGVLAIVRPNSWEFPLFFHVLGAMTVVGALIAVAVLLLWTWRTGEAGTVALLTRAAFRTLLFAAVPGYVVMRVFAQWIESKEDIPDDPSWLGIGYITSDGGFVLLIVTLILVGIGVRRMRTRPGGGGALVRVASVLVSLMVLAYFVAMWAMTTKPD